MTTRTGSTDPSVAGDVMDRAQSVSEWVARIAETLERDIPLGWVRGEISGFRRAASGHCYFDLKDERAQLACVLFRNRAALVPFLPADGQAVECRVRISVYEPRGALQAVVEQMRAAGAGRLYEEFLRLKARLAAAGLFDAARKRPLPREPRSIGIITSPQAAAFADLLRVLGDRWPLARIVLYPASVQGGQAAGELRAALATANQRAECDVLIIARGGGSLEDLWAFNDEALVRSVAASALPIVSAVGHETDFTLTDFAADLRAATPSAAAMVVAPDRRELLRTFDERGSRLVFAVQRRLAVAAQRIDHLAARMTSTHNLLRPWQERLRALDARLESARSRLTALPRERWLALAARWQRALATASRSHPARTMLAARHASLRQATTNTLQMRRQQVARLSQALELLAPTRVLERGYAIALAEDGQAITDARRVQSGQAVELVLARGRLATRVETIRADDPSALCDPAADA